MPRKVQALVDNVLSPTGAVMNTGDQNILTDQQYSLIPKAAFTSTLSDLGQSDQAGDRTLSFPVTLANITGNGVNPVSAFLPGFAGTIKSVQFVVTTAVTTGSKLVTLTPNINAVAVTGGVLALTSALATPLGKVIAGSSVTALNVFNPTDTITFVSSGVTAFVEGAGVIVVDIR